MHNWYGGVDILFYLNMKQFKPERCGDLFTEGVNRAEIFVLRKIQEVSISDENDKTIVSLQLFKDEEELILLKSRISNG